MAEYKPLFVYLEPASIPQVVAHIQKYLAENPIVSDPKAIAEAIQKYIEEHPEIIAVASVNGKTGNVVLTGSDIMINPSSAVSVETQLLNLASMINNTGASITQIQANISQIYTDIETIQTDVETNTSNISALQTSVEGQGTRLATAETDIDNLETAQTAQGTRLNTAEGNISSLQTRLTQAETDIDDNESDIGTLNENISQVSTQLNTLSTTIADLIRIEEVEFSGTIPANATFAQMITQAPSIDGYTIAGLIGIVFTGGVSYIGFNRFWFRKNTNQIDVVAVGVPASSAARNVSGFVSVMYVKTGCCINNTTSH